MAGSPRYATRPDFERRFAALLASKREVVRRCRRRGGGDHRGRARRAATRRSTELSLRFDRVDVAKLAASRSPQPKSRPRSQPASQRRSTALKLAHDRVMDYHRRQKPADLRFTDALGVELGWRWRPIDAVGLYVPGGAASYPSSVMMNAAPAKVAGSSRLAMVVPTPEGHVNPLVLAAARIAGVDEIYRVGGAQAIAALAYGTADDRAGRQDRRTRQRLCRRGQAPGFRRRRHRHDRGPVRSRRACRSQRRSALCRRRSAGAGRAR